jgi:hypothetical protein
MSFHVGNLRLTAAISDTVREISKALFAGPAPRFLHHYTCAATVEKIIQNRCLWATCVDDQSDKAEISHASGMVTELAEELSRSETHAFAADVLKRLPYYMEERKQWIYIACFCDDHDSGLHWREYGNYRLTFSAPWTEVPSLAMVDIQAECWPQRVIYDEKLQRDAIERALRSIALAISANTAGRNEGPWAQAMVDNCARNTAQLLLGVAVGFKRKAFESEREWRIVCAPRLGSNNSAPKYIDDNFSVNVKGSPRRHLLLQIPRAQTSFRIGPVPFVDWARNPNHHDANETDRIKSALRANHRSDLACL